MLKSVSVAACAVAFLSAPAFASGRPVILGFGHASDEVTYFAPRMNQTVIVQTGKGDQAVVTVADEEDSGPQAWSLGVDGSVESYVIRAPNKRRPPHHHHHHGHHGHR